MVGKHQGAGVVRIRMLDLQWVFFPRTPRMELCFSSVVPILVLCFRDLDWNENVRIN